MRIKNFALIFAGVFAIACTPKGSYDSLQNVVADFEYHLKDSDFGVNDIIYSNSFRYGTLYFLSKMEKNTFAGGFALTRGEDTSVLTEPSKKPHKVHFKPAKLPYSNQYLYFHDTGDKDKMPKFSFVAYLPNSVSSCTPRECYVNNTNEVVNEVKSGLGKVTPFVKGDWIKLTATGYLNDKKTGEVSINLVDFTEKETILTTWTKLDLTPLNSVNTIIFSVTSNKEGVSKDFCLDNFAATIHISL